MATMVYNFEPMVVCASVPAFIKPAVVRLWLALSNPVLDET